MSENQNKQGNKQSDGKSPQSSVRDDKKKETNPGNPSATESKQQGSPKNQQPRQDTAFTPGKIGVDAENAGKKKQESSDQKVSSKQGGASSK